MDIAALRSSLCAVSKVTFSDEEEDRSRSTSPISRRASSSAVRASPSFVWIAANASDSVS